MDNETTHTCPDSSTGRAGGLYPSGGGSIPPWGSCQNCGKTTSNPKFCSRSCAAVVNNRLSPKRKREGRCLGCETAIPSGRKFCTNQCQAQYAFHSRIDDWLSGRASGLNTIGCVTPWVKRWLRETRGDFCELCGWDKINETTGVRPLVADHIDGNWKNNVPSNLRLICPSCDSLQPTYKALNSGNGRSWRRLGD